MLHRARGCFASLGSFFLGVTDTPGSSKDGDYWGTSMRMRTGSEEGPHLGISENLNKSGKL